MRGTFSIEKLADSLVIVFGGDIGEGVCEEGLDEALSRTYSEPGNVVIDLTEVSYMDSTAFGSFMELWGELKVAERRLALVSCSADVLKHLDMLGLTNVLHCFGSVKAALGRDSSDTRLILKEPSRRKSATRSTTKIRTKTSIRTRSKTGTKVRNKTSVARRSGGKR